MERDKILDILETKVDGLNDILKTDGIPKISGYFIIDIMIKPLVKFLQLLLIPLMIYLVATTAIMIFVILYIIILGIEGGFSTFNFWDYTLMVSSIPGFTLLFNLAYEWGKDMNVKYREKYEIYKLKHKNYGK